MNRKQVPILAAVFLDLLGFGMLIPDVQIRAERLGARGWLIGALLASTFVVQFFASPWWGSASDRIGRKNAVLVCTALSAASMFAYGFATSLWIILASRLLSGLGSANYSVAQAWISDSSTPADRTAAMARIGAALSAGLVGGPAVGGWLATSGGVHALGFAAGCSSALGLVLLAVAAPPTRAKTDAPKGQPLFNLTLLRDLPRVRALALVAIVAWFSLAMLEGTFGRLIERTLGFTQREFGLIFGFESLAGLVVQGTAVSWAAHRFGDRRLLRIAFLAQGIGLAATPFVPNFTWLVCVSGLYAVGASLSNPTINSLCSALTPSSRQGELFGLLQGMRAVGLTVGPLLGGLLFDFAPWSPYALAGFVSFGAAAAVTGGFRDDSDS